MGYLYANSEPFPSNYDFITALDAFLTSSAQALLVNAQVREIVQQLTAAQEARARSLTALDELHAAATGALEGLGASSSSAPALAYLRGLGEHAAGLLATIKSDAARAAEAEDREATTALEAKRGELKQLLAAFLTLIQLPTERAEFSMRTLSGRPELEARLHSPGGVAIRMVLNVGALPQWQTLRKVLELTAGLRLPMDVKKGWFSGSVQHQTVPMGDFLIGGFELGRDKAELRLRRKTLDADVLVLDLQRAGVQRTLAATMRQPGAPLGSEAAEPAPVAETEAEALTEIWTKLAELCQLALEQGSRGAVLAVELKGEPVVENDHLEELLRLVVEHLKPIFDEVDQRSPNDNELSLKYEAEAGRRQEIYRTKIDLGARLVGLDPEAQTIFAPFGLEIPQPPAAPPAAPPAEDPPA